MGILFSSIKWKLHVMRALHRYRQISTCKLEYDHRSIIGLRYHIPEFHSSLCLELSSLGWSHRSITWELQLLGLCCLLGDHCSITGWLGRKRSFHSRLRLNSPFGLCSHYCSITAWLYRKRELNNKLTYCLVWMLVDHHNITGRLHRMDDFHSILAMLLVYEVWVISFPHSIFV